MAWTYYSQTDPRWANALLGYNTDSYYTIGRFGCLVAAWGNLMVACTGAEANTPINTNNWLKENNGFLPGGGVFIWSAALNMGHVNAAGTSVDINYVNDFLRTDANFAILEVSAGGRQHFVFAPYVDEIIDSQDGKLKSMSTYPFVGAHLFTAQNLPTPVIPTSGTLDATVDIIVPLLNARTEPTTASPAVAQFHAGYAHITGWSVGQDVTVGGRTDNVWLKSDNGHWFTQAGTDANFGHLPANLTSSQHAHLSAATFVSGVKKSLIKGIRK
jgi:hypothetical protein